MTTDTWLTQLQENGYRLTGARAVVEPSKGPRAPSPLSKSLTWRAKSIAPSAWSLSIALEKLEELHLIQRVHQPQGCQAFISASQGHEHLLLCQSCGQVTFFEGDDLDTLTRAISKKTGYQISEHWLQLFGLCQVCQ
jgi:Fe2+ or Zn2+ uptake regulation protein